MQGTAPLASPRLNPRGTGSTCRCRRLNGGVPPALLARRALAVPGGGLPSLSPAAPVFSLLSCPLFPRPPSQREGETLGYFMQGASPLASPGLNPRGTRAGGEPRTRRGVPSESPTRRKTDRTAFLLAVPAAKERGGRGRGTSAFEMVLSPGAERASAGGGLAPTFFFPCLDRRGGL